MTKLLNNTVETLKDGTRITTTYRNTLQEIQAVRAGQQPKEILRPVRRLTEQENCQTREYFFWKGDKIASTVTEKYAKEGEFLHLISREGRSGSNNIVVTFPGGDNAHSMPDTTVLPAPSKIATWGNSNNGQDNTNS